MLRRKLWLTLGPLVAALFLVAVAAIWLLQGVLKQMDHIRVQGLGLVEEVNALSSTIGGVEAALYGLQLGQERHLDPLILADADMRSRLHKLGSNYVLARDPAQAVYQRLLAALPPYEQHVGAMATTRDANLAAYHGRQALSLSVGMRTDILQLGQIARDHVRGEQSELTWRFRWIVLGLALIFLLAINLAVLVLVRAAGMVLQPVDRLVQASRELGREHFEHRVDLEADDEFGELAAAYNSLARQLQENERRKLEMIGQVAATLNHELNNALAAITLQLELLSRPPTANPDQSRHLRQIHESLSRMTRTVEALKHVRRIVLADYADGIKMLDLERSIRPEEVPASGSQAAHPMNLKRKKSQLLLQLAWLVRLRWLVGAAVIAGGLANSLWLRWYDAGAAIAALGVGILAYNVLLFAILARQRGECPSRVRRLALAWVQMLSDLAALTFLVLSTGGLRSPILGLYVLHMVFASLLLPGLMPYAAAAVAAVMLTAALLLTHHWPDERSTTLTGLGWLLTLFLTVHLANRITRSLRHHRKRLIRQNHQIRAMTDRLRQQQQAMIQQEKLAAMGQMAAGVAHEIANPLASMDSLLQLMQRQPDKPRPQAVETLRQQLERVHGIVRELTTFAHPSHAESETASVNQAVASALELLRYDPRLAPVRLETHLSPDAGSFRGPRAVQQVLINLLINALDAMEQTPEPRLTLTTSRQGPWCLISIADNGHGICPEHLPRLFEPFFTTKPVGKGTGLGLSVSHALLRQQGGDLQVRAEPGAGAEFTLRLLAADATSASMDSKL